MTIYTHNDLDGLISAVILIKANPGLKKEKIKMSIPENMRQGIENVKENVELTTADGKKITASKMALDVQHGLLSVPGAFTMDNKGVITRGRGLKSDIEFRRVLIKSEQITP